MKSKEILKADLQQIDFNNLLELNNNLVFNCSVDRLKDEIFKMLYNYISSPDIELNQDQKDHIFHFYRMYCFYQDIEKKLVEQSGKVKKAA